MTSPGMSRVWIWAVKSLTCFRVASLFRIMTSPVRGMLPLSRPLMFMPTLSPGPALSTRLWCISTVNTLPTQGVEVVWVGRKTTSSPVGGGAEGRAGSEGCCEGGGAGLGVPGARC